jgi:hypothetical protein
LKESLEVAQNQQLAIPFGKQDNQYDFFFFIKTWLFHDYS